MSSTLLASRNIRFRLRVITDQSTGYVGVEEEQDAISFEAWRDQSLPYYGCDTSLTLTWYLDGFAQQRLILLDEVSSTTALHEAWIFWQFMSCALGEFSGMLPVFAGRLDNIRRVHHVACVLRAECLSEALRVAMEELQTIDPGILNDYIRHTGAMASGDLDEELCNWIAALIDTGYDTVVRTGKCKGAIGAPPRGDSGFVIKDALTSYLGAARDGDVELVGLPLTTKERAELQALRGEKQVFVQAHREDGKRYCQLIMNYENLGHSRPVVQGFSVGPMAHALPLFDVLARKGMFLERVVTPIGFDRKALEEEEAGVRPKFDAKFCKTQRGLLVSIFVFLDGCIAFDVEARAEIARIQRPSSTQIENPSPLYLRLAQEPAIVVDTQSLWIRFPRSYEVFAPTLRYAKKLV